MSYRQLKILFILYLFFSTASCFGQGGDKKLATRYFDLFQQVEFTDVQLAKVYADSGLYHALKSKDAEIIGRAYQFKGWLMQDLSEFSKANSFFKKSLEYLIQAENAQGIADAYGNLGNSYFDIEDYHKSLDYQLLSLSKNEEILKNSISKNEKHSAKQGLTFALHNIGIIYSAIGMYEEAIEYEHKSLVYEKESNNTRGLSISYNTLALLYKSLNVTDSAVYYYNKSLSLTSPKLHPDSYASTLQSFSTLENSGLAMSKRKEMLAESLRLRVALGDENGQGLVLLDICETQFDELPKDSLSKLFETIHSMIESNPNLETLREKYYHLYARYASKIGDFNKAYFSLENFVELKEVSDEKRRAQDLVAGEIKRQFQEKNFNDSIQFANSFAVERAEYHKEISEIQTVVYLSIIGVIILGVSLFIFINSNRRKKKINSMLSEKNSLIEEKSQSISDSINYAQRLQLAILPTSAQINRYLPSSFLYFLPKDMVSGDFYWFEQKETICFVAVADCTGHGVPGAMMSVVCSDALSRSMNEFGLNQPAQILNKTRELVIQKFEKSNEYVSDGMDVALIALDLNTLEVVFSGANNPLCIIRKNEVLKEEDFADVVIKRGDRSTIIEVKGDKQPIGSYAHLNSFTQYKMQLIKGDKLYLFTDGFADQFGGDNNKKFKYAPFKRLLLRIESKEMEEQKNILGETFQNWKGDNEQVDDVCIMGIEV